MKRSIGTALSVMAIATALLLTLAAQAAPNATITVTTVADTVADDGECGLREAIQAANSNSGVGGCPAGSDGLGGDIIAFAIPGEGPHTIALQSALPEITSQVVINGLAQPGASCEYALPARSVPAGHGASTSLLIELDGSAAGASHGLTLGSGSGGSGVYGLVINRFQGSGIHVRADDFFGVTLNCIFIGTDVPGAVAAGNGGNGIYVQNSARNTIQGTVVAGNGGHGILIEGSQAEDNVLAGNFIGTNPAGSDLGNSGHGILAQNSGPQIIGGTYGGTGCCVGNTIAFNGGGGVVVSAAANVSYEKGIRGNRIYANDGLGIDLENDGVTPNDLGDADGEGSANRLQNFPTITAATVSGSSVTITGTLNSNGEERFYVDFFANDACDPSGYGEGERFLGLISIITDAVGDRDFTATLRDIGAGLVRDGNLITATATDPVGNSSEFSQCVQAVEIDPADERLFLPWVKS